MKIGKYDFDFEKDCYVMGILNVTDDSFSDGGKFNTIDKALFHTKEMIDEGAGIIDIGGYSTRPGHLDIPVNQEIDRVAPILEKIRREFDVCVSIDTFRSEVFEVCCNIGCDILNDVWGLKRDPKIKDICSYYKKTVIVMHNRMNNSYDNFLKNVVDDLKESIYLAQKSGIKNIIVDPGIGFAKNFDLNYEILSNLDVLKTFNLPILLAASKKRFLATTLEKEKENDVYSTLATTAIGFNKGACIFRVHDVKGNYELLKVLKESKKYER